VPAPVGRGAEASKRQTPAVRAAVLLPARAAGLAELLDAVRPPEADPLAADRRELKRYLLGPDEPPSIEQFNHAVKQLALRAESRNTRQRSQSAAAAPEAELAEAVPVQRVAAAGDSGPDGRRGCPPRPG